MAKRDKAEAVRLPVRSNGAFNPSGRRCPRLMTSRGAGMAGRFLGFVMAVTF